MKDQGSNFDIIIIGGGLAGLTAAIHLSKFNKKVLVIEKNQYPKHKVCGEYISNEVLPYLNYLEIDPFEFGAKKINRFQLSTKKSKLIAADLPLGGFGISRFAFDNILAKKAVKNGAVILQDLVVSADFTNGSFRIKTKANREFSSRIAIGAFGKRSLLDIRKKRDFIKKRSPYLAVKMHAKGDFPEDLVALHNFKGGYCGVSKVENDHINLCYITNYKAFKAYKSIEDFQKKILFQNRFLKTIFSGSKTVFENPLTISQISFATKEPVEDHIIMCGDSAGMIHPLCGNGMSMAIRSAQIASQLILNYLNNEISSRDELESAYSRQWNKAFRTRLKVGHFIAALFRQNRISEFLLIVLRSFPFILPKIIKQTHGKPMSVS